MIITCLTSLNPSKLNLLQDPLNDLIGRFSGALQPTVEADGHAHCPSLQPIDLDLTRVIHAHRERTAGDIDPVRHDAHHPLP